MDRHTGARRWRIDLDMPLSAGVGGDDGRLFVVSESGLMSALSATDGHVLWQQQVSTEVLATPSAALGIVVVRSVDGRVAAHDVESGGEFWSYSHKVPALSLRGNSRPFIVRGGVLVALDNGRMVALASDSGRTVWEARLAPPSGRSEIERLNDADASLAVDQQHIYAANYQGVVAKIDPATGRLLWTRELSIVADMHVADGVLYVTDVRGHVWALDTGSGASLWKQDKLQSRYVTGATPVGEYLVVADLEGYLHWLARADGRFVARTRVGEDAVVVSPLAVGDMLYALNINGELAAFQLPSTEKGTDSR
jgi:outer membrane protein assembly factor BamB